MDQAFFGARSAVQVILSLTVQGILSILEGGRGENCIKVSCHRGRVTVDSFLRDKSFIVMWLLLEIRALREDPSISLQNQVGTQQRQQKVELPEN